MFYIDNMWIWLFTIPLIIYCIYKIYILKTRYLKVKGMCTDYDSFSVGGAEAKITYRGTYKYTIDGKEYITTQKDYTGIKKTKKNKDIVIFVDRQNYSNIEPRPEFNQYIVMLVLAVILSVFGVLHYRI